MEKMHNYKKVLTKLYRIYQHHRLAEAAAGCFLVLFLAAAMLYHSIPDEIQVDDLNQEIELEVPVTLQESSDNAAQTFLNANSSKIPAITGNKSQTRIYECRLFGVLPLKQILVTTQAEQKVIPGGIQVGIYAETTGVMVIGQGEIQAKDGLNYLPADHKIQAGDYILSINGTKLTRKEDLVDFLSEYAKEHETAQSGTSRDTDSVFGDAMTFHILRNEEELDISVEPVETKDGSYKLGLWVRDDLAGVGTLTYYTKDLAFGALGHCVSDYDTSQKVQLSTGILYEINIVDIVKGVAGTPGELTGVIDYDRRKRLGDITTNSDNGIYGTLYQAPSELTLESAVSIGHKQEIQRGEAELISYISEERKTYSIEITDVDYQSREDKDILFKVTDPELIEETGGIVQGMSGSPILQNGRLIGAVTHVFISDPEKGYGIFIEDMLKQ